MYVDPNVKKGPSSIIVIILSITWIICINKTNKTQALVIIYITNDITVFTFPCEFHYQKNFFLDVLATLGKIPYMAKRKKDPKKKNFFFFGKNLMNSLLHSSP